jgi:hypothetical protein
MIGTMVENKMLIKIFIHLFHNSFHRMLLIFPIVNIFLSGCAYITDIQSKILNDPYLKMQAVTTWPFNGDYDWPTYDDNLPSGTFSSNETNGYYVVRLECYSLECNQWSVEPNFHPLSDSIVQVNSKQISGGNAECGIIIRGSYDDGGSNAYFFGISDNKRSYRFIVQYHNKWRTLIDWTESTSIRQNEFNTLMIRSYKDNFELFINGTIQNKIKDSTLSGGYAGLLVSLQNQGDQAVIYFDDFQISE